MKDIDT